MTKQELLDSRKNIPPMAYNTKRPAIDSGKYRADELPRLLIEDYNESKRIEAMISLDFEI